MGGSGESKMKIAGIIFIAASVSLASFDNPGEFFGVRNTNRKIYQGLLNERADFYLADYAGSYALGDLLGYQPGGLDQPFRNGIPNPTNMMLWSLALERVSTEIGSICHGNSDNKMAKQLRDYVLEDVLTLCSWPDNSAKAEELWDRIWFYIIAYDAPESELLAWKDFFKKSYQRTNSEQLVSDVFFSVFMNPHFLLRK